MLAAMMVHGVSPGPLLIQQSPALFWGFIASMYVGNVMLLVLNLPMVGVFVNGCGCPTDFSTRPSSCSACWASMP
jgi:putative tricarboxylic transport membrane protein